jgi:immune inhibitor A
VPKKGWITCSIVTIVFLCVGVFCLSMSLLGLVGAFSIFPTFSSSLPLLPGITHQPTPSLQIIRPSPEAVTPPISSPGTASPLATQGETAIPKTDPVPVYVVTDTIRTLKDTVIPINDPIEIAHRLLGLDNLSRSLAPVTSFLSVGAEQSFWVGNDNVSNTQVKATLQYVTEHAYFWIENGVRYRTQDLRQLAEAFENQIYPTDRAFFGSEWTPGVDGDQHIYILYASGLGEDNAGYFSSGDEYPRQINQFSNAHEIFLVNADNSPLSDSYTYGVLAHEFQHMIHWYQDRNEASWINEGFSELAVLLNGYYYGGFDALYTSQPDIQLNDWPDESKEDITPHYGASFLFISYFLDRFGEKATKALIANQDNDMNSVDSTLKQIGARDAVSGKPITADTLFLDWAVTNYLIDKQVADGRYTYRDYLGAPRAGATETVRSCLIENITRDVHQYGVDYIQFTCPGSYTMHFEGSIQTDLLPEDPHSGKYAFWSNKSDESDTTLTKSFDLSQTSGPITFSYWTWYDIEQGWDYVYLEASTDGENWQILNTPSGTSANPQGNNYGWGYTGNSGKGKTPIWIEETVDLSQYAGQNLALRFEYITDSNVTGEGFLLDDLSIPEIGYSTDFETGKNGWQAEGWARIENILPQNYVLALISVGKQTTVQDITLNPNISADIPFTIGDGVDNVVLVVSGVTRYTRQLAPYRYSVTTP